MKTSFSSAWSDLLARVQSWMRQHHPSMLELFNQHTFLEWVVIAIFLALAIDFLPR